MAKKQGYIRPYENKVSVIQRLCDGALIAITHYVLSLILRPGHWSLIQYLATAMVVVVFIVVGELGNLYRPWRAAALTRETAKVWSTWLVSIAILLFVAFAFKATSYGSRVVSTGWFIAAPTVLVLWRFFFRTILKKLRAQGRNCRTVAIVGATKVGEAIARRIATTPDLGMKIIGFYDDRDQSRIIDVPDDLGEVRGSISEAVDKAKEGDVDVVYIALPLRAEARINDLVNELADTTASVYVVADFFVFDLLSAQWSDVQGIPVVSIFESPFYGVDGWLKRLQDIIFGSIIGSIIAIPMVFIALGIKLTSKGPVFFRQRRYGLGGQEINMLKFRSMTVCEDGSEIKQATKNDARVTKFGAFIRRTSLDELPQFFQVMTGEMSIVGPRPHAIAHNEEYRRLIHGYMLRHKVKPGITGWAQINGWRGETDTLEKMEKRVEYDLEYIQNWNFFLDVKIIIMTVFKGFVSRNAY